MNEECAFFSKVGACRHGQKCVRKHSQPKHSKTIVLMGTPLPASNEMREQFIIAVFVEIASQARIHEFAVAGNESPHLRGNIYVTFENERDAATVLDNLNARWLNETPVFAQLAPMDSASRTVCREGARCIRSRDCNYVHLLEVRPELWVELFSAQEGTH